MPAARTYSHSPYRTTQRRTTYRASSRYMSEFMGAFIKWGITLGLIAGVVLLILVGLIGFESVSNGTTYFVPENPAAGQQQTMVEALNGG